MDWILCNENNSIRDRTLVSAADGPIGGRAGPFCLSSWDYNYTVGEIAGRRMDCNCGSAECRRRVL